MASGIEILNDYGTFLVTDKNPSLHYVTRGNGVCNIAAVKNDGHLGIPGNQTWYYTDISIPYGYSLIHIAYCTAGWIAPVTPLADNSQFFRVWSPTNGTTFEWYMFARSPKTAANHGSGVAGLVVFDDFGRCCFDSTLDPAFIDPAYNVSAWTNTSGTEYVVTPAFPAGRKYATFVMSRSSNVTCPSNNYPGYSNITMSENIITCGTQFKALMREVGMYQEDGQPASLLQTGGINAVFIDVTKYGGTVAPPAPAPAPTPTPSPPPPPPPPPPPGPPPGPPRVEQ